MRTPEERRVDILLGIAFIVVAAILTIWFLGGGRD